MISIPSFRPKGLLWLVTDEDDSHNLSKSVFTDSPTVYRHYRGIFV